MGVPGQLTLTVLGAERLKDVERFGKQDPYCIITCGVAKCRTKTCTDGGTFPKWGESMEFTLNGAEAEIQVSIFNDNTLMKDELIGCTRIPLDSVFRTGYEQVQTVIDNVGGKSQGLFRAIVTFKALGNALPVGADAGGGYGGVYAPPQQLQPQQLQPQQPPQQQQPQQPQPARPNVPPPAQPPPQLQPQLQPAAPPSQPQAYAPPQPQQPPPGGVYMPPQQDPYRPPPSGGPAGPAPPPPVLPGADGYSAQPSYSASGGYAHPQAPAAYPPAYPSPYGQPAAAAPPAYGAPWGQPPPMQTPYGAPPQSYPSYAGAPAAPQQGGYPGAPAAPPQQGYYNTAVPPGYPSY